MSSMAIYWKLNIIPYTSDDDDNDDEDLTKCHRWLLIPNLYL